MRCYLKFIPLGICYLFNLLAHHTALPASKINRFNLFHIINEEIRETGLNVRYYPHILGFNYWNGSNYKCEICGKIALFRGIRLIMMTTIAVETHVLDLYQSLWGEGT